MPATNLSVALIDEYLALGLRDVVLSPGSRSQALALVAAEYERRGLLRLRVRIDERVGAFLALGLAVETSTPVLVITTSGTAVANLHPAVLEAHHSGVPLIIASADRPTELRGIGANQATNQPGIFGTAVTHYWDNPAPEGNDFEADAAAQLARDSWAAATTGHRGRPGPVQVNLAFREPLSGPIPVSAASLARESNAAIAPSSASAPAVQSVPTAPTAATAPVGDVVDIAPTDSGTVVIAGAGAGEHAEAAARALGAPLLAEVSSGAHFGPNLVVAYRELLAEPGFGDQISRIIVFGHPTLSREIPALISRADVTTTVVRSAGADDYNPGHRVAIFADTLRISDGSSAPAAAQHTQRQSRAWVGQWVFASRSITDPAPDELPVDLNNAQFARRQLAIVRESVTRRMLVEAVWRSTWPHDRLVLGASRLIREADQVVSGKKIRVHANRGLAGIDGTIATALGIALASQATSSTTGGTTRVLIGDITALHDVGALLLGGGEIRPRIQVIVGNDGGGTIFDGLEVGSAGATPALDRVMFTPHDVNFEQLAAAYGWNYLRVRTRGEMDEALASSAGPQLIEVVLARL
ncbi:MAG TPA: 2-succinyl-5-enolpyruvyl-6-hydroxy-3-cyclohexene-1-carboxylic-acid synthase [Glaciihabitans sp.]|nr:2-succinyl-5-enolpyruvyl-6-hydroxy-3-cyclohexene-1-carboxylic-acid synthase [Glaciihabitans sp.]